MRELRRLRQKAWHVLEPNNRYVHNWHADAIGEHLEAVTYGKINPRLLINVPPGTSKSLLVSVPIPHWRPEVVPRAGTCRTTGGPWCWTAAGTVAPARRLQ